MEENIQTLMSFLCEKTFFYNLVYSMYWNFNKLGLLEIDSKNTQCTSSYLIK